MSFSVVKAGTTQDVRKQVEESPNFGHEVELGKLTRQFLGQVLELVPSAGVIVEASGYASTGTLSLSVSVRPTF